MSLPTDKQARKERPIARGVLAYFPDAIAEVARVSFIGNAQHNPGEEMHWSRGKSSDHADCAARHLIEAGTIDEDGLPHTAKLAWRALAMLQLEMEWKANLSTLEARVNEALVEDQVVAGGVGSTPEAKHLNGYLEERYPEPRTYNPDDFLKPEWYYRPDRSELAHDLRTYGCTSRVAEHIANGISFSVTPRYDIGGVYIAGPMRGHPDFNFPAFDAARDRLLQNGWDVISPADIDRSAGLSESDQTAYVYRDFFALYLIAKQGNGAIAMLPEWEKSTGASAEFFLARWLGLKILDARDGEELRCFDNAVFLASVLRFLGGQL